MNDWVLEFVADIHQLKPQLNLPSASPGGGGIGPPPTASGAIRRRPVSALPTPTGKAGSGAGDSEGGAAAQLLRGGSIGESTTTGGSTATAADVEDDATSAVRSGSLDCKSTPNTPANDSGSSGRLQYSGSRTHEVRYRWLFTLKPSPTYRSSNLPLARELRLRGRGIYIKQIAGQRQALQQWQQTLPPRQHHAFMSHTKLQLVSKTLNLLYPKSSFRQKLISRTANIPPHIFPTPPTQGLTPRTRPWSGPGGGASPTLNNKTLHSGGNGSPPQPAAAAGGVRRRSGGRGTEATLGSGSGLGLGSRSASECAFLPLPEGSAGTSSPETSATTRGGDGSCRRGSEGGADGAEDGLSSEGDRLYGGGGRVVRQASVASAPPPLRTRHRFTLLCP